MTNLPARKTNKPTRIIVHHSVTSASSGNSTNEAIINNGHKTKEYSKSSLGWYVGYHFMVFPDGEVKRYREDNEEGAHAGAASGMNFKSIGICLIGNFSVGKPTKSQAKAALSLITKIQEGYSIDATRVVPHRKYKATQCWGVNLSDDVLGELQNIVGAYELTDDEWFDKHFGEELNSKYYDSSTKKMMRVLIGRTLEWARSDGSKS